MNTRLFVTAATLCFAPSFAFAQPAQELPPIVAEQDQQAATSLTETQLDGDAIAARRGASPDALEVLRGQPGYSSFSNGGISSLPSVRGLADDRILTTIDGAPATSFCPNHMNPASSYIQADRLASVTLTPTLSPVSAGGDNIGGVIALASAPPIFTESGVDISGSAGVNYRSVSRGWGANVSTTLAGEHYSLGYDASYAYGANYLNGAGDQVRSTEFEAYDQAVTFGARTAQGDQFTLRFGRAFVPYEGFPTQPMDLTANESVFVNAAYDRELSWGELHAALNWRSVDHEMNFLDDKGGADDGGMPMISKGDDYGAQLSLRNLSVQGVGALSGGIEVFLVQLDDYWPPVASSMMMGPNTYININDGERNRYAVWGEWTAHPSATWTTTAGLRYERVETDAGDVQSYDDTSMMSSDPMAAAAFNAREHAREDNNVDANLTALWRPSDRSTYEFGITRKTRSPNLYERYAWGTGEMSSMMTNFAGDANGYIGDIDLDPEIAHSIAASAEFTGDARRGSIRFSAYYTRVSDYIDADYVTDLGMMGGPSNTTLVQLRFANHDAALYGFEVSGRTELASEGDLGLFVLSGSLSYTHGENQDTGDALYHIAPLTAHVALEQTLGRWTNTFELELVGEKDRVNDLRNEPETGGYALAHLRTNATFGAVRVDLGVENLFDVSYDLPLGGVSYGDYIYAGGGALNPLQGPGRSVNLGLSVAF